MPAEEVFCFRCRETVEANGEVKKNKKGRFMFTGKCPKCGGKVFKFMKDES